MSNLTFYRKANVSSKEATDELLAAHPGHSVSLEVELATTDTARHARAEVGDLIYVATLKQAEGPEPEFGGADDGPAEDSAPEAPEPAEEKSDEGESEEKSEPKEEKSEEKSEDKGEKKDSPPKSDGPSDGPEEHKMKPEEEMVHLLKQILEAVGGGLGLDAGMDKDPLGPPEPHGAGPGLPPKKPAGPPGAVGPGTPGGPPAGGPPLPPPVDKEPAGAAFASVRQASAFSVVREQANELGIRGIKAEAESLFPTHRVAKIRTTGFAQIDGEEIYLPEARLAVIELTRR